MVTIDWLIRSRTLRKLLELFSAHPDERYYFRKIERLTGEPVGALQKQLAHLEETGLLHTERQGPLKFFQLNKKYPYREEIESLVLRDKRCKDLQHALKKVLNRLKKDYLPDRVILYGSLAKGHVQKDSDLDLMIIKSNLPQRYRDRLKQVAPFLADCPVGIDFALWTPEEWSVAAKGNRFLQEEVISKGRVVYEGT